MESAFNYGSQFVVKKWPVTPADVDEFLTRYFARSISPSEDISARIREELRDAERQSSLLSNTKKIDYIEFYGLMQDESIDSLVYFYNSSKPTPEQQNMSRIFNHVAKFTKNNLHFDSLVFASYDIAKVRLHDGFSADKQFSVGSVYMVNGGQTQGPFLKFNSPKPGLHPESLLKFALMEAKHELIMNQNQEIPFSEEDEEIFKDKHELFDNTIDGQDPNLKTAFVESEDSTDKVEL